MFKRFDDGTVTLLCDNCIVGEMKFKETKYKRFAFEADINVHICDVCGHLQEADIKYPFIPAAHHKMMIEMINKLDDI